MNKQSYTPLEKISNTIADLLTDICESSPQEQDTSQSSQVSSTKTFLSKKIPSISINEYLDRLIKYTKIEASTLVLVLIFVDRVCEIRKIRINYFNIHKLLLASLVISIKYNEDDYYENKFYAKVGGVTKAEVDRLEYDFLCLMEFSLFVNEDIYNKYYQYLLSVDLDNDNDKDKGTTGEGTGKVIGEGELK